MDLESAIRCNILMVPLRVQGYGNTQLTNNIIKFQGYGRTQLYTQDVCLMVSFILQHTVVLITRYNNSSKHKWDGNEKGKGKGLKREKRP